MLKGVILSIMASLTFGVLYFYTQLLGQLDSADFRMAYYCDFAIFNFIYVVEW